MFSYAPELSDNSSEKTLSSNTKKNKVAQVLPIASNVIEFNLCNVGDKTKSLTFDIHNLIKLPKKSNRVKMLSTGMQIRSPLYEENNNANSRLIDLTIDQNMSSFNQRVKSNPVSDQNSLSNVIQSLNKFW